MKNKYKKQNQILFSNDELPTPVTLPLECVVEGVPATLQSPSDRKKRWKQEVKEKLKTLRPRGSCPIRRPDQLRVIIHYYYFLENKWDEIGFDIDNIIKPILDSGNRVIYDDDEQIAKVCSQRFDINEAKSGSELLLRALATRSDFVHLQYLAHED